MLEFSFDLEVARARMKSTRLSFATPYNASRLHGRIFSTAFAYADAGKSRIEKDEQHGTSNAA